MKILFCLLALVAVALARPQNLPFYQEGLQIGSRIAFLAPHEQVINYGPIPLVNILEDVPFDQQVDVPNFLIGLEPNVAGKVGRSVAEALS